MKIEASIRRHYDGLRDVAERLAPMVEELLREAAIASGWHFEQRIKEMPSYALKLATGRDVDDFYGCTIVVPTLAHVPAARKLVEDCLAIVDERPRSEVRQRPTEFAFDSLRLYCMLKESVAPSPQHAMLFEVQVKTLLEEAWSKATHDVSYKGGDVSWAKERLAAQLKAMLDNVELSIAQFENLSSAPSLAKRNPDYVKRSKVLGFLRDDLGRTPGFLLPSDLRTLTDTVHDLLQFLRADLSDLKLWIAAETVAGRGTQTSDLSIYSMVLQSALNQNPTGFSQAFRDSRRKVRIFMTDEIEVPPALRSVVDQRMVRLGDAVASLP